MSGSASLGPGSSSRWQGREHQKMERTIPIILQFDETFDVGADTGTPVTDQDYQVAVRVSPASSRS